MDVVPTCFRFSIFEIRFCRSRITSVDTYAFFAAVAYTGMILCGSCNVL